jgi:hypothetical protein
VLVDGVAAEGPGCAGCCAGHLSLLLAGEGEGD